MKPFLDPKHPYDDPYGVLKADAPKIAKVARDAVVTLTQAKTSVAANNARGVAVTLLDIATAAVAMFFLDSEAVRDDALKNLTLGPECRSREADRTAKMIREEVAEIEKTFALTSTSARAVLARKSHFSDGTKMVSLTTIHLAFTRSPKR